MHSSTLNRARAMTSGMTSLSLTVALIASGMAIGCSGGGPKPSSASSVEATPATVIDGGAISADGPMAVEGTIRGTAVRLETSELDSMTLSIYEGDSWGFNPSLLIFLFLDDSEVPAGRTFTMSPTRDSQSSVHVHYRWRDPASGEIHTEMVTDGYELELKLGDVKDGLLPGTIAFAVPGEDTHVQGSFRARIGIEDNAS